MKSFYFLFLIVGCCASLSAQEPVPDPTPSPDVEIDFPVVPVVPVPDVEPLPPKVVDVLPKGSWYIVQWVGKVDIKGYPAGHISIKEYDPGKTHSFIGKFVDGTGAEDEERDYPTKVPGSDEYFTHIYRVKAELPGKITMVTTPYGFDSADDIIGQMLTVTGGGPNPPPGPDPPPDPGPGPIPIPGDSKRALIVYESSELSLIPPSQAVLITSGNVRDYLDSHCSKGPDGITPERRIWDKDVDLTNVSETWKKAMALPRTSIPWLVVSNGVAGYSGPLPLTEAELLTTLKKYLGE